MQGRCQLQLIEECRICVSSAVVRRDALARVGGFYERPNPTGSEDYDMWLRLSQHFPFAFVDEVCVRYRIHDQNMSGNPERMARGFIFVMKALLDAKRYVGKAEKSAAVRKVSEKYLDIGYALRNAGEFAKAGEWLRSAWLWDPTNAQKALLAASSALPRSLQSAARSAKRSVSQGRLHQDARRAPH